MAKVAQETKKERVERVINECYPRMRAIAKIEVLFDQILSLLPLTDSKEFLKEQLMNEMAAA